MKENPVRPPIRREGAPAKLSGVRLICGKRARASPLAWDSDRGHHIRNKDLKWH